MIALAIWLLSEHENTPHHVANRNAPAQSFSAIRAETVLARILGPERPHPVGSAENAAVRSRIRDEFSRLGVATSTYRAFVCRSYRGLAFASCATVTDILADALPGQGKAVALMAHYDSVPAGPGASDDESSVAAIIESVRALKAQKMASRHPVLALITDGEEGGLLGAEAFLQDQTLKARIGAVVNFEARGTSGPSLLFQTSPGNGRLIDLYAAHAQSYATSSLYAEIYKALPNDTDLTLFIREGFPAYNFAFVDNVRYYHSPRDTRANLDPASLQMQGDNVLGVASGLESADFAKLKSGDSIYLAIEGKFLPRLPASWALPSAIFLFVVIAFLAWFKRPRSSQNWRMFLFAGAMPVVAIAGAGLFGWFLALIAQTISGRLDPTYAHPLAMRFGLAFAVWTATLLASRMATRETALAGVWVWIGFLGVVAAALLPGLSPYFLIPAAVAAAALGAASRSTPDRLGPPEQGAALIAALASFFVWIPFVVSGEALMGLRLHPLFTLPAAFAMLPIVPLLAARPMTGMAARLSLSISAGAAIVLAVLTGLEPAYSKASPQRVDLVYFEGAGAPARWIADTAWKGLGTEPIPQRLLRAEPFKRDASAWQEIFPGGAYSALAGPNAYFLPQIRVLQDRVAGGLRTLEIGLHASAQADGVVLYVPKEAGLRAIALRGQTLESDGAKVDTRLVCLTPDCRDLEATLTLSSTKSFRLRFAEIRYGLPASGARLKIARGDTAVPSQSGDETVLADSAVLPAH